MSVADSTLLSNAVASAVAGAASADGMLYVGYSGGLDSTVLLHVACRLFPERVAALHVNHGLHADAGSWQRHCERVCTDWGVALHSREVEVGSGNLEAAARTARYDYFAEVLGSDDVLLLAHHQDDQAETVLLRIAQGRGLIGMPRRRAVGQGSLLRPLLGVPRAELQAYARLHDLRWVEDPSNTDLALDRNYLRARIMPLLRERWPAIGSAFEELMEQRQSVDELLLAGLDPACGVIAIDDLCNGSEAVSVERLRVWLQARRAVAPSGRALHSFVAQLAAPADRQPELKLNTGTLRRHRESVYHVLEQPAPQASYAVLLPGSVSLPHGELQVSRCEEGGFSAAGEVRIVFRRDRADQDDRLLLRGHRRGVNKLLQEAAVPPWERQRYPLLVDDLGLAAIPGVACRDAGASTRPGGKLWQASWRPLVR